MVTIYEPFKVYRQCKMGVRAHGLSNEVARQVALELSSKDVLDAHLKDELVIT